MNVNDAWFLSMARPGQINPGWVAFWKTSDTSVPAAAAVWADTSETWYLTTNLAGLAQTNALTVKPMGTKVGDYTPPTGLVAYVHTITTPTNPGFLTGLTKYFVIKNSGSTTVAVIAQDQSNNPWIEHWWLDQNWVDLAPGTGTTITLHVQSQSSASTAYNSMGGISYKKHTFAP